jgi:hypothetical protein
MRCTWLETDPLHNSKSLCDHTLATEILENGGCFEEVADVLGKTSDVVRKHYAKWSPKRQARIDGLMERIHGVASYAPAKLLRVK